MFSQDTLTLRVVCGGLTCCLMALLATACADDPEFATGCEAGSACRCPDGRAGEVQCAADGSFLACGGCDGLDGGTDGGGGDAGADAPTDGPTDSQTDTPADATTDTDGDTGELTCPEGVEPNPCGGCAPLPDFGQPCGGECGTGTWECGGTDQLLCASDDPDVNVCGGCDTLVGLPGETCAVCGHRVCSGPESLICDDPGANACGGCDVLEHAPDDPCGPCNLDQYACEGTDLVCSGETAENACGGCEAMDHAPDDPCGGGDCGSGSWQCDGPEVIRCESESGTLNDCGGCAELVGTLGDDCGTCGQLACSLDGDSLECEDTDVNACGGCGELGGVPNDPCGDCGNGVYACVGDSSVVCEGDNPNDCGGCEPLEPPPGDPCGECGQAICDETGEATACDDPGLNLCGGCTALSGGPGEECSCSDSGGGEALWTCSDSESVDCLDGTDTAPEGTTLGDLDPDGVVTASGHLDTPTDADYFASHFPSEGVPDGAYTFTATFTRALGDAGVPEEINYRVCLFVAPVNFTDWPQTCEEPDQCAFYDPEDPLLVQMLPCGAPDDGSLLRGCCRTTSGDGVWNVPLTLPMAAGDPGSAVLYPLVSAEVNTLVDNGCDSYDLSLSASSAPELDEEYLCADGEDNNGNAMVDCADDACTGHPNCL